MKKIKLLFLSVFALLFLTGCAATNEHFGGVEYMLGPLMMIYSYAVIWFFAWLARKTEFLKKKEFVISFVVSIIIALFFWIGIPSFNLFDSSQIFSMYILGGFVLFLPYLLFMTALFIAALPEKMYPYIPLYLIVPFELTAALAFVFDQGWILLVNFGLAPMIYFFVSIPVFIYSIYWIVKKRRKKHDSK